MDVTTLSVHPVRDVQQVTSTWVPTNVAPIAGVVSHEITNVITNNGFL
ncbi:MAG: hypothetical protein HZB15_03470, partial [Actinobacteria bacterium]|nr:hypothetical protein [Actinomycetota bacterium]